MRTHRCRLPIDAARLGGKRLDRSCYDVLVGGDEPADVFKYDGSPLLKYRPRWFSSELCTAVVPACRRAAQATDNRGMAAGEAEEFGGEIRGQRVRSDGVVSNTVSAKSVRSGIVGYFNRTARAPFCRATSFVVSEAAAWQSFLPYIERADEGFREFMPDRWARQNEYARRTASDWIIPQSTFTTVTVNRNFQTATHRDAGDLAAGFGVMSCLRNDRYDGAFLVFPAHRVAVNFAHGCLALADVHEWHGNTAFERMRAFYERITLVFYYREKMVHCKNAAAEVEWAKNRQAGARLSGEP